MYLTLTFCVSRLSQDPGYVSKEIQMVYRVITAGGQPAACNATTSFYIDYSAEYWIYN